MFSLSYSYNPLYFLLQLPALPLSHHQPVQPSTTHRPAVSPHPLNSTSRFVILHPAYQPRPVSHHQNWDNSSSHSTTISSLRYYHTPNWDLPCPTSRPHSTFPHPIPHLSCPSGKSTLGQSPAELIAGFLVTCPSQSHRMHPQGASPQKRPALSPQLSLSRPRPPCWRL